LREMNESPIVVIVSEYMDMNVELIFYMFSLNLRYKGRRGGG